MWTTKPLETFRLHNYSCVVYKNRSYAVADLSTWTPASPPLKFAGLCGHFTIIDIISKYFVNSPRGRQPQAVCCSIAVVTKTWNDLKPPKTTYNHLKPSTTTYNHLRKFNNHLQQPQKHQQPLANNLTPSETRHKCLKQHVTYIYLSLKSYSPWFHVSSTMPRCNLVLGYKIDFVSSLLWNSTTIWL